MRRIIIVGSSGSSHIGESLLHAAGAIRVEAKLCDTKVAWQHGKLRQKLLWHFGGRRPLGVHRYETELLRMCDSFAPDTIVSTGMAPVRAETLRRLRASGVRCVNFSTDDPFNPQHRATWFRKALREYDVIFTPRRANEEELRAHGCRSVVYLPFGYDPELFHPVRAGGGEEESDLMFAGVGDNDRLPFIAAPVEAGLRVRLHGIDWDRFPETAPITRGQADIPTLRRAIVGCRVALCLVRRSNRDGHSMRTFEVPAVGACMVVEDTREHREIFGEDGAAVSYFRTPAEMVNKTKRLLDNPTMRARLRDSAGDLVTRGGHTYADRLRSMLAGTHTAAADHSQ